MKVLRELSGQWSEQQHPSFRQFDIVLDCKPRSHSYQTVLAHSNHLRPTQTHTSTQLFNTLAYFISAMMLFRVEHRLDSQNFTEHIITTPPRGVFNLVQTFKLIHFRGCLVCQSADPDLGCKRLVAMDPLHYEYVIRVQQLWDERMPPKRHPTDYYLEQQRLARPWEGPVPDWAFHHDDLPPTYPLFQRCVLAIWAFLVTIAGTVAKPFCQLAGLLWKSFRTVLIWTILLPVKLFLVVRSVQLEHVVAALTALFIVRWLPGMTGEEAKQAAPLDNPVYVLMIREGERLSKPMIVSFSPFSIPDGYRNRPCLSTSELNHRPGNN